ncbi:EPIDERMAL PATTERNING FACTOR-like protein 6 [Glycine soja]
MESKRNTITLVNKTHLLCNVSFFLFLICTLAFCSITIASSIPCLDTRCPMLANADIDFEELKGNIGQSLVSKGKIEVFSMNLGLSRGILSGPGSVPPTCHSKCCKCTPCKPTLCSVHNEGGTYYPLRWLCKCGNKFYNP